MQGRKSLKVEWDDEGFEHLDSEQILARMREDLKKPGPSENWETAFQQSAKKIEAVYETPYQSHSCMEPLNCIAHVQENSIEIWGPIQEANWIQADLSARMGIPANHITVNMTFLGGGFGRKAFTDYPHEAAQISKEIKAPVQVVWTREDDMSQGPFRPGALFACKGGLGPDGNILAFQAIVATQPMGEGSVTDAVPEPATSNSGGIDGLPKPYYASIPHFSFGGISTKSPIPTMWWRAPSASTHSFACESFIDELAHAAGKDPLGFRRSHLREGRYQALIDRLEALSGWKSRGKNEGWGVAITECFGSIVGHIVKVSHKPDAKIKIDKVIALMDCGWYVNPDIIRAQVEGSIVMGLGAAIKHETHFKDGKAVEKNFDAYKMPRIGDIPEIEVHIMDNDEKPGGVGEPGLPPLAPALCNAIFDLTGKRIRKLPFNLDEV
jgi:isoquinoline 1-oxidoreductase beta subunit